MFLHLWELYELTLNIKNGNASFSLRLIPFCLAHALKAVDWFSQWIGERGKVVNHDFNVISNEVASSSFSTLNYNEKFVFQLTGKVSFSLRKL